MNAFVPQNPRVVVYVDTYGKVHSINNIDPDLVVEVVELGEFDKAGAGLPYDSRNPCPQTQVLAMKKGK